MSGPRSFVRERNHPVGKNLELKVPRVVDAGQNNAARILPTHTTQPKPDDHSNVKLRGAPTLKPEQRAYLDDTHNLEMPRQGVSLLNDMLGRGRLLYKTHPPAKTLNNINMLPLHCGYPHPTRRKPGPRAKGSHALRVTIGALTSAVMALFGGYARRGISVYTTKVRSVHSLWLLCIY